MIGKEEKYVPPAGDVEVTDLMGDVYTLRVATTGTADNPHLNVFGPVQYLKFDRASLDNFYQTAVKMLNETIEPVCIQVAAEIQGHEDNESKHIGEAIASVDKIESV